MYAHNFEVMNFQTNALYIKMMREELKQLFQFVSTVTEASFESLNYWFENSMGKLFYLDMKINNKPMISQDILAFCCKINIKI